MELAAPLPCCTRATSLIQGLLSVCLFGSTTVAISIGEMFKRGELTNVLEDKIFSEEIL
jgi:hypothetical protein